MLSANVKIITELRNFVAILSGNRDILRKFCASDSDFTRRRKLSFDKLALLITRLCKKTLSIELEKIL